MESEELVRTITVLIIAGMILGIGAYTVFKTTGTIKNPDYTNESIGAAPVNITTNLTVSHPPIDSSENLSVRLLGNTTGETWLTLCSTPSAAPCYLVNNYNTGELLINCSGAFGTTGAGSNATYADYTHQRIPQDADAIVVDLEEGAEGGYQVGSVATIAVGAGVVISLIMGFMYMATRRQ